MVKWDNFNRLYTKGVQVEKDAKTVIETFFKEDLKHMLINPYSYYDFINSTDTVKYEVKSYNCCYKTFNKIILPFEKIQRIKPADNFIFILVFTNYQDDPLNYSYYYIKYNKNLFSSFDIIETYIKARDHKHLNVQVIKDYIFCIKK